MCSRLVNYRPINQNDWTDINFFEASAYDGMYIYIKRITETECPLRDTLIWVAKEHTMGVLYSEFEIVIFDCHFRQAWNFVFIPKAESEL